MCRTKPIDEIPDLGQAPEHVARLIYPFQYQSVGLQLKYIKEPEIKI